jgi:hypothetical protein
MQSKALIILAVALLTGGLLKAQTFNEHQSIREQLMKGSAPGLRFAPASNKVRAKDDVTEIQKKENQIMQIRKGTAAGLKFQAGGTSTARTATPQKTAKQGPLASELEKPKEQPKASLQPVLPTQEEAPAAKQ